MDFIKTEYNTYIKPNLCLGAATAGGHFFISPMLTPYMGQVPLINSLGLRAREALLVAVYSFAGIAVCRTFNWMM